MRVEAEITYPAGPGTVAAMLADPEFVRARNQAMHPLSATEDVEGSPTGAFTVTTVRTMPTTDFPDAARRLVGESVDVRQVDAWAAPGRDGRRTGTMTVEIAGAPIRMQGDLELLPTDGGSLERVTGDLKASVPLVGGRLEKAAEPAITAAIRTEERVGREWLASRSGG